MRKLYSVETKQLVCSLFREFKSYREIEALTGVPRDVLRLWKARARNDEAWVLEVERKSLLSYEEKEEIVRLHSLGESITDLAIRFNVYRTTVKSIINSHRKREGKPAKRVQSQFFASSIADSVIEGRFPSAKQAAEFYGLEPRTVQRWVKSELQKDRDRAIVRKNVSDGGVSMRYSASAVLAYTMAIKEWILKNFNLKDHSDENIVSIIGSLTQKGVPIKEACSWLGINRSTFYRKRKRQLQSQEPDPLVIQMTELQKRRNFSYGAKRMAVYLSKINGFAVNHKKVARLMRLHGLNSRVRPKRRCPAKLDATDQTKEPLVNLLKRDFSSKSPMKKLVTDMTFIPVVEGWLVLSTVKDLFNHKIVAWETAPSATLQLALNTIKKLVSDSGKLPENSVIHSDRGGTYTSETYIKAVKNIGARPSYSRSGRCLDNASMESFYGHMKSETFYRMNPRDRIHLTRETAREIIADYVRWYNTERIQRSLGYLSPEQYKGPS